MNSSLPGFLNRPFSFGSDSKTASLKLHNELEYLLDAPRLKINDQGNFVKIGLIGWIWEQFKEILGWDNRANLEILRFRLIQMFAQAAEEGLLTENDCSEPNNLIKRVAQKVGLISSSNKTSELNAILEKVIQSVTKPAPTKPEFQHLISSYRIHHANQLQPHSIIWKIANLWQKQQENTEEFTQDDFETSEEQDHEPTFSDQDQKSDHFQKSPPPPVATIQEPSNQALTLEERKNPLSVELLETLKDTQSLAEELEKLTFSKEISYKDLYLRLMLVAPSPMADQTKLIHSWISDILTLTSNPLPNLMRLDQALKVLNFRNAFPLLVVAYRLPILFKNEEERQLDPSKNFIKSCDQVATEMGSRLSKLIQEHPEEYQALDLTDLTLKAKALQFDVSSAPFQFRYELMEQQRVRLEREKAENWIKLGGLGLLLGSGALLGGAAYAIQTLTQPSPPPPPTIYDYLKDNLWKFGPSTLAAIVIGGVAYSLFHRLTKSPTITLADIEEKLKGNNGRGDFTYDHGIKKATPENEQLVFTKRGVTYKAYPLRIQKDKSLVIPHFGYGQANEIDFIYFKDNQGEDYLIIASTYPNFMCYVGMVNLKDLSEDEKGNLINALRDFDITDKKTTISLIEKDEDKAERLENKKQQRYLLDLCNKITNATGREDVGGKFNYHALLNDDRMEPIKIIPSAYQDRFVEPEKDYMICRITADQLGLEQIEPNQEIIFTLLKTESDQDHYHLIINIPTPKMRYLIEIDYDRIAGGYGIISKALEGIKIEVEGKSIEIPLTETEQIQDKRKRGEELRQRREEKKAEEERLRAEEKS